MRYLKLALTLALGATAMVALARPNLPAEPESPVYLEAGQYRAVLDQTHRYWKLLPLDGQDLVVSNPDIYCRADARVPAGLWLVGRDDAGRVELRAPSATTLPDGHDGTIALRACNEGGGSEALHVPVTLLDWLAANAGAVWIDD